MGLNAVNSVIQSLDFTFNRLLMKLFRTNSIDVVKDCQYYFGCEMSSRLIKNEFDKFILRYNCAGNVFCKYCCVLSYNLVNKIDNLLLLLLVLLMFYLTYVCVVYFFSFYLSRWIKFIIQSCKKVIRLSNTNRLHLSLKPGFHYLSWRPELSARVDGWPVSITRQHEPCWRVRVSTSRVDGPSTRQIGPLTRAVSSGSGNRALASHSFNVCRAQSWF